MKLAPANNKSFATLCFRERRRLAGVFRRAHNCNSPAGRQRSQAFTLAEVLAAMLFLAIVIPVAVEALHVSSLAGEVAARKGAAVRIADRVLNESLVTTNWTGNAQNGTVSEGALDFQWNLTAQNWPQAQNSVNSMNLMNSMISMEMLTAQVTFQAQGKDYTVKLSTLANSPNQAAAMLSLR
jgi:hypothetical protein